jgi:hypothetical protein
MSLTIQFACEDFESLLDEMPDLHETQVCFASDTLRELVFAHDRLEHIGEEYTEFFDDLEQRFGLENVIFGDMEDKWEKQEIISIQSDAAVVYFEQLIDLLNDTKLEIPSFYFVNLAKTPNFSTELSLPNGSFVETGYNQCVLVGPGGVHDLRNANYWKSGEEILLIIRSPIYSLYGYAFSAMQTIAEMAVRNGRNCVVEVF